MKKLRLVHAGALAAAALIAATSCGKEEKTVTVTKIGWIANNIATDFWASPPVNGATACYTLFIGYEGDLSASDIESASLSIGGTSWSLADEYYRGGINAARRQIGGGYYGDSDTPFSLPVGAATATIKLTSGYSHSYGGTIPVTGSLSADGYTSTYTEDLAGTPPPTAAPMLRRAAASGYSNNGSVITLQFAVNDNKAQNGDLWLFSSSNEYVGVTRLFCDPATDAPDPAIAASFHTNGAPNAISVGSDDVDFEDGFSFSQIKAFRVVLFDGKQYEPAAELRYDARSVSQKYTLP